METQSASISKIAEALASFQSKLKPAKKTAENPFFKSHYADLNGVVQAAQDAGLGSFGLAVSQIPTMSEGRFILVTTLLHVSGEWLRGEYPISPVKQDPQSMGSATTYARRYAYQSILGIPTEDDDGNAASGLRMNGNGHSSPSPAELAVQSVFADEAPQAPSPQSRPMPYTGDPQGPRLKPPSEKQRAMFVRLMEQAEIPESNWPLVLKELSGWQEMSGKNVSAVISAFSENGWKCPEKIMALATPVVSDTPNFDDEEIPF